MRGSLCCYSEVSNVTVKTLTVQLCQRNFHVSYVSESELFSLIKEDCSFAVTSETNCNVSLY